MIILLEGIYVLFLPSNFDFLSCSWRSNLSRIAMSIMYLRQVYSRILINTSLNISYFDCCSLSLNLLATLISSIQSSMTPNYWTPHLNLLQLFGTLGLLNGIYLWFLFRHDCLNFKLRNIWFFFLGNRHCVSKNWLLLSLDWLWRLIVCLTWRDNWFLFYWSIILNTVRRWTRI